MSLTSYLHMLKGCQRTPSRITNDQALKLANVRVALVSTTVVHDQWTCKNGRVIFSYIDHAANRDCRE